VFSVPVERLNTEVTETLRVLCVEAFEVSENTEKFVLVAPLPRCTTAVTERRYSERRSLPPAKG
jgi:hypothetical protein